MSGKRSDPVGRLKEAALAYADVEAEASEGDYHKAWINLSRAAVAYAGTTERVYCDNGCGRWWYWQIAKGRPRRFCSVECASQTHHRQRRERRLTEESG